MIWDLVKQLIKKLPGIRYVVEGRDRYIQLYTDLLSDKDRLEMRLLALEDRIAKREQELASANEKREALEAEISQLRNYLTVLQKENQNYKDEGECHRSEIKSLKDELFHRQEEIQRLNFRASTEALDSSVYWNTRYAQGGNSGTGSYNHLAQFKSDTVNAFLIQNSIVTVLEIGCGDGNQLQQVKYVKYIGVDVSPIIIEKNREKFKNDSEKQFYCTLTEREQYANRSYDLTISMDVIFHLLEEKVFHQYMDDLFTLSEKFVVIYSSNHEEYTCWPEFRHRNFTGYIQEHYPDWEVIKYVPNKYPYQIGKESETSASDFYFFRKIL